MEIKYHKDYRHNFLIIKNIQPSVNSYQCRMITDNEIKGLLPCRERHINGEQLLYYEITSKQSLASLYECGGIGMELLFRLFIQLKTTWDAMSGFLLEEKYLVLKPEFVFLDVETEDFSFLYYPEEPEEDYMAVLLEFLTEKVNNEDNQAVDTAYKMLELVEKEQFVMDEILQWFEQDCSPIEEMEDKWQEQMTDNRSEAEEYRFEEILQPSEEEKHPAERMSFKMLAGNMMAALLAAIGCVYVFFHYELGEREAICLCVAFMAALAVLAFCGVQLLCRRFLLQKASIGEFSENKGNSQERYDYSFLPEGKEISKNPTYGNTVFIPWTENCENKLYGMGKGNKNHIDLNHLPITVGKLAGSVDMVINEQSISRRHAKFAREGGRICMTDLNSTNGTFKNGMRLVPNTSEILEPGDEIRLGKLKFIYR